MLFVFLFITVGLGNNKINPKMIFAAFVAVVFAATCNDDTASIVCGDAPGCCGFLAN